MPKPSHPISKVIRLGNIIRRFIEITNKNKIHVNRFLKVSLAI